MKEKLVLIYHYLFLALCFVIPFQKFSSALPNILLISLGVLFPFVVKKYDFKKLKNPVILTFLLLVFFVVINMVFFQDVSSEMKIVKKIATPIAFLLLFIPIRNIDAVKRTVILSSFICILVSLINIATHDFSDNTFNFSDGILIRELLIIDRLYLGFLCVISILFSIELINKERFKFKNILYVNIVVSILFVLLVSSRIAIILMVLLLFLKFFYAKDKKKILLVFAGVFTLVIIGFSVNKNLRERFFYTQSKGSNKSYIELAKGWEPRIAIWSCCYSIAVDDTSPFLGNGFYGTKDKLVNCYEETIEIADKKTYFVAERFNPHNQFFDLLLSYGVIPFLLFCILFILLFFKHRKNFDALAVLFSLFFFSMIECYFQRQMGGYYFGILFFLLITKDTFRKTLGETKETLNLKKEG